MDFEKAVADLVEGTTESKDAGSASDQLEANSKEWLNRVRGQVAKASRKSRRKRRDEENLVYEENKRLRKERDEQLLHISELEEKLREKQSELTTKPEDLRYIHQNELLRMQIEQHRIFYTKYLKLSEDVPVDEKESIETIALSKLELEGLEFSFLYVQSLLSSSVSDNWSPVELDANQFYMIKPGRDVSGSFKFVPLKQPRMNLRLDMVIRLPEDYYETDRKVNPMEACMKAVWDFWGSEKHVRNYFPVPQKFTIKKINIRSTNTEFDEYKENAHDNIDENICAYYYHELREKEKDRGWMYLVTKRLVECARSTLLLPAHLAPSSCSSIGEKKPENNNKGKKKNDKKNMKKKDSGMLYGKTKVWVMARSTVQHVPEDITNRVKGERELQQVRPSLIEGAVIWEEECIKPSPDDGLLETIRSVRCAYIISMSNEPGIQIVDGFHDIMDKKGVIKPQFCQAVERFYTKVYDTLDVKYESTAYSSC